MATRNYYASKLLTLIIWNNDVSQPMATVAISLVYYVQIFERYLSGIITHDK